MTLVALMFTAFGTAIASVMEDFQGFQLVMNFLVMPTFFLSGALFPLTNVPPLIGAIATIDPLSYGVDGVRGSLTGVFHFGVATDFGVLAILTLVCLAAGSYLFSRIQL
jgi:ABC-2 type transport system permease protein